MTALRRRPLPTGRPPARPRRRGREAARRAAIVDRLRERLPGLSVGQLRELRATIEDILAGKRVTAADYERLAATVGESDAEMSL